MKTLALGDVKNLLRARVTEAASLRACARTLGVSAAHLSNVLVHAQHKPGPKLLRALGYKKVEMYLRKEEGDK